MISPSEAIEKVSRVKGLYAYESDYEALDFAICAIKKQIPQKPMQSKEARFGMGYEYYDWVCPTCGKYLAPEFANRSNIHHCKCGQAIDWSKND